MVFDIDGFRPSTATFWFKGNLFRSYPRPVSFAQDLDIQIHHVHVVDWPSPFVLESAHPPSACSVAISPTIRVGIKFISVSPAHGFNNLMDDCCSGGRTILFSYHHPFYMGDNLPNLMVVTHRCSGVCHGPSRLSCVVLAATPLYYSQNRIQGYSLSSFSSLWCSVFCCWVLFEGNGQGLFVSPLRIVSRVMGKSSFCHGCHQSVVLRVDLWRAAWRVIEHWIARIDPQFITSLAGVMSTRTNRFVIISRTSLFMLHFGACFDHLTSGRSALW